jgi:hypothetical protein
MYDVRHGEIDIRPEYVRWHLMNHSVEKQMFPMKIMSVC